MVKKNNQEMVQLALDTHKWINTPIIYSELNGDFTTLQQDVLNMISGRLQDYVKKFLDEHRYASPETPKPIFTKEEMQNSLKDIRIPLRDLNIGDQNYVRVNTALDALRKIFVRSPVFEEGTGQRVAITWFPIFEAITVPQSASDEEIEI